MNSTSTDIPTVASFLENQWNNPPPALHAHPRRVALAERYHSRISGFDDKLLALNTLEDVRQHLASDYADFLRAGEFKDLGYAPTIRDGLPALSCDDHGLYADLKAKLVDSPAPTPDDTRLPARVRMRL